jgi:lysophospholipase L1-like esterase
MKSLGYKALIVMLSFGSCAVAQQTAQPPSQTPPSVTPPSTGFAGLDHYRASRIAVYMNDYGQLARYREADAALKPAPAGENRVVFFGDSITDLWKLEESFPGKPYINRGIGGQTTSQMLVRFRQDVIDLQPKAVVILAGTNDIAGNTGPISNEDIEANFASLAELARAHKIRVIYSSVLPVHDYTPQSKDFFAQRPPERILEVNRWLKDYCSANNLVYLDYFAAMADGKGLLKRELSQDGLHPNQAGFAIMAPLAEKAIETAISSEKTEKTENELGDRNSISITLGHNSERERETRQQLQRLLSSYDLGTYTFTHDVVIDEQSIPHSPVLKHHTRHLNSDEELLSTYVHEQLHWYRSEHSWQTALPSQTCERFIPGSQSAAAMAGTMKKVLTCI